MLQNSSAMFNYRYPVQRYDETDEEYQQRCEAYEDAESQYIDEYVERCQEERHRAS